MAELAPWGGSIVTSTVALLFVCALAVGTLRALGRRQAHAGGMRVHGRLPIEPRRSLVVVEVAGRWFLVGIGDGPMSLIAELDAADARARLEAVAVPPSRSAGGLEAAFAAVLRRACRPPASIHEGR